MPTSAAAMLCSLAAVAVSAAAPNRHALDFSSSSASIVGGALAARLASFRLGSNRVELEGPRWKKGKDEDKGFAALAAANPMSAIVAELKASFTASKPVAILSAGPGGGGGAVLGAEPEQAMLLSRAAFGHAVENAAAAPQKHRWFQLSPEEVFYLCHALSCIRVESREKMLMSEGELWDHFRCISEKFPEMYKAYSHLRLKNWVVRSGLQYGADFVAYRHHPALVHSEFVVVVVPEGA